MTNVSQASEGSEDDVMWFVQLSPSQVRVMSLDELDDAFQRGRIDEHTLVRQDGASVWAALGNVAGLDSAADATPASQSLRPVVSELSELEYEPTPRRSRRGMALTALALAVLVGGVAFGATKVARSSAARSSTTVIAAAPRIAPPVTAAAAIPAPPPIASLPAAAPLAAAVRPAATPAKKAGAPKGKPKKSKAAR